jgi:hypothetical protein
LSLFEPTEPLSMLLMLDEEDEPEPMLGEVAVEPELLLLSRLADEDELDELLLLSRLACANTGVTKADTVKTLIRVIFLWREFFIAASALPHSCQGVAVFPSRSWSKAGTFCRASRNRRMQDRPGNFPQNTGKFPDRPRTQRVPLRKVAVDLRATGLRYR